MNGDTDFVMVQLEDDVTARQVPDSQWSLDQARQWLEPTDYLSVGNEYMKHLAAQIPGTGQWLRCSERFKQWRGWEDDDASPAVGCFWLKGVPGAGKSVWAAATARELAKETGNKKAPVLFFFFRRIVATNSNPVYLVRDWLSQLLPHSPRLLPGRLQLQAEIHDTVDKVPLSQLWQELCQALDELPKAYCVADALDEMDDGNDDFILRLAELGKRRPECIKVLLTSRPIPRIETILRDGTGTAVISVRLEQSKAYDDVVKYVQASLERLEPRLSPENGDAVQEAICGRAQGLFLLARLMMENLIQGLVQGTILPETLPTSLDRLPRNLCELYSSMLAEHAVRSGVSQALQMSIIQWVTHSFRPLRLIELGSLVSFMLDLDSLSEGKAIVRLSCGRLLEILEDETVSVIHHSFTEFVTDESRAARSTGSQQTPEYFVIDYRSAHRDLAMGCLRYLESRPIPPVSFSDPEEDTYADEEASEIDREEREQEIQREREFNELKLSHAFLQYAIERWSEHVLKADGEDAAILTELDAHLVPGKPAFSTWLRMKWPSSRLEKVTALHVAAYIGLAGYLQHLLATTSADFDCRDGEQRTPLSYAAECGHTEIVRVLGDRGAEVDSEDRCGLKPLHYATTSNELGSVKLLLAFGATPTTPKTKETPELIRHIDYAHYTAGDTPLFYACSEDCTEIIFEFIKYLTMEDLCKALHWAVKYGSSKTVSLILETGKAPVDVFAGGATALYHAASRLDPEMLKLLLDNGANPNLIVDPCNRWRDERDLEIQLDASYDRGTFAIRAFANHDCVRVSSTEVGRESVESCLKLLLEAGCDIQARDRNGRTALHLACQEKDQWRGGMIWGEESTEEILASVLLNHGADATATDYRGNTPLHGVSPTRPNLVDLLVRHGADVNAVSIDGKTPLHTVVGRTFFTSGDEDVFTTLTGFKADCNARDNDGNTALHILLGQPLFKKSRLDALITGGADVNMRNKQGRTPIHMLREYHKAPDHSDKEDFMSALVAAGLDLNARDANGGSVLFHILDRQCNDRQSLRNLLDLGCSITVREKFGATILHKAVRLGCEWDTIQFLISSGANPNWVDDAGNTLFHEVAKSKSGGIEICKKLTQLGVSALATNHRGQTPLHLAFATQTRHYLNDDLIDSLLQMKSGPRFDINQGDCLGARPIHYAATLSEYFVGRLLKAGADATVLTVERASPLHCAARARQSNVVALLLSEYRRRGVVHEIIGLKDVEHRTALHYAARSGRPESVRLLLECGANAACEDGWRRTPLHLLAEFPVENRFWYERDKDEGRLDAACVALSDGSRPRDPRDRGYRPATFNGTARTWDILDLLVKAGGDMNARDHGDNTPMDVAVMNSCVEMVQELRHRGIDAKESSLQGMTTRLTSTKDIETLVEQAGSDATNLAEMVGNALQRRDNDLLKASVRRCIELSITGTDKGPTGIYALIEWGHSHLLQTLFEEMNQLDRDKGLETTSEPKPLLIAACERELPSLDIVRFLVEDIGVDVNVRGTDGYGRLMKAPALHYLAAGTHFWKIDALRYLIKAGADVESTNEEGETALMVAASTVGPDGFWGDEAVRVLLEAGADPNAVDNEGRTCLNNAKDASIVRMLIQKSADILNGSQPPVSEAIFSGRIETIQALLEAGADPNTLAPCLTYDGGDDGLNHRFLLHEAARGRRWPRDCPTKDGEMTALLLKHGADPLAAYGDGSTVLQRLIEDGGVLEAVWNHARLEIDLERRGKGGRTLLLSACLPGVRVHDYSRRQNGESWKRVMVNQPGEALKLLNKGANATVTDDTGSSALHLLCDTPSSEFGDEHEAAVKAVIERAGERIVHLPGGHEGLRPLHLAARRGTVRAIEVLLAAGANALELDPSSNTLLHLLARNMFGRDDDLAQKTECFRGLLALGIPINAHNQQGNTPLFEFIATSFDPPESFDDEAALNKETNSYQVEHQPLFPFFSAAGADFHARNNSGETLLHILAAQEKTEWRHRNWEVRFRHQNDMLACFKYLLELGLDPGAEDGVHRTPVDVAMATGNKEIVDLFQDKVGTSD